jgi:hypothetical protein
MESWPQQTNITELRGPLGLTRYYRKLVCNNNILTKPLTYLLTKKGFQWNPHGTKAFEDLKHAMMQTPMLALPKFDKTFAIETDECDTGMDTILS